MEKYKSSLAIEGNDLNIIFYIILMYPRLRKKTFSNLNQTIKYHYNTKSLDAHYLIPYNNNNLLLLHNLSC